MAMTFSKSVDLGQAAAVPACGTECLQKMIGIGCKLQVVIVLAMRSWSFIY